MEDKYLGPLLGVFLGWLLTYISYRFKEHKEKKQIIGKLLSELVFVHSQILVLKAATDIAKKNIDDWMEYEVIRQIINEKHFLEPSSRYKKFQKYVEQISGIYPLESNKIQSMYNSLLKIKKSSLSSTALKNKQQYIKFLSVYETGLEFILKDLIKFIKKYSLRFGFLTYLKILILLQEKQNMKDSKEFLNKYVVEMFESLNEKS